MLHDVKPKYSEKAFLKCQEMGINTDSFTWDNQRKFDNKRVIFKFEHYYTISSILKLCRANQTIENIREIIENKFIVVWILKEENDELNKKYKSTRPDPALAYKEAGISFIN